MNQKGKLIWITGLPATGKTTIALELYKKIKKHHSNIVHLDGDSMRSIWGIWAERSQEGRKKMAMSYAKQCALLTSQGIDVIMSTVSLFHEVHEYNRKNNEYYYEIFLKANENVLDSRRDKKSPEHPDQRWQESTHEFPKNPHLILENNNEKQLLENVEKVLKIIGVS